MKAYVCFKLLEIIFFGGGGGPFGLFSFFVILYF